MKKANSFQIAKVQPQGVAQLLLNFCQFQPGVAYKSVAYKKKACNDIQEWLKRQQNSAIWFQGSWAPRVMSEIYLLNACKLDREENFFDFSVEPIAFRIRILINITLF